MFFSEKKQVPFCCVAAREIVEMNLGYQTIAEFDIQLWEGNPDLYSWHLSCLGWIKVQLCGYFYKIPVYNTHARWEAKHEK